MFPMGPPVRLPHCALQEPAGPPVDPNPRINPKILPAAPLPAPNIQCVQISFEQWLT